MTLRARGGAIICIDLGSVLVIDERILFPAMARRVCKSVLVDVDHITFQARVVGQRLPRQRMIALAHPEKAPKGHHHIGDLARDLVDHEVEYRPELLAGAVIYGGALDLVRGDEAAGLVNSDAVARRVERP